MSIHSDLVLLGNSQLALHPLPLHLDPLHHLCLCHLSDVLKQTKAKSAEAIHGRYSSTLHTPRQLQQQQQQWKNQCWKVHGEGQRDVGQNNILQATRREETLALNTTKNVQGV